MISPTYCNLSWDWYAVDISTMEWQMCPKPPWRQILEGDHWPTNDIMTDRRQAHLEGRRHSDCSCCWTLEDQGVESKRQSHLRILGQQHTSTQEATNMCRIEIKHGNTCDLACRYCWAGQSSIWALRDEHPKWGKDQLLNIERSKEISTLREQFWIWFQSNIDRFYQIRLTGGEAPITKSFYETLERMRFKNKEIMIITNGNTPATWMNKFIKAIDRLLVDGNKVLIRFSLDGVSDQHTWQRQGGSWDTIVKNIKTLSAMPIHIVYGLTLTPLSLESMVPLTKFVNESASYSKNKPSWNIASVVHYPWDLHPGGWYGSFQDEIIEKLKLLTDERVDSSFYRPQVQTWIKPKTLPSQESVKKLVAFLDDVQLKWSGIGEWRNIYPKVARICDEVSR